MLAAVAVFASAVALGMPSPASVPLSDRFGLCIDLPHRDSRVRIYAPTDTVFAVLYHHRRALVQFRIDTMPGEALREAEKLAEAHPGWSSGSFYFYGAVPGQGDLIVVKNDQSDLYRNLFITVSRAGSLPSWVDVSAMERSISHCGRNAPAEPSVPPLLDTPEGGGGD
ncbi:MAG TPA: hypothetical protein VFR91_00685 [Dyella sp.]|nr:hypothetical protein [Dyella sp.]